MTIYKEGSAVLFDVGAVAGSVPSRKDDVFYNVDMKHQRDVFVAVMNSFKRFPSGRSLSVGLAMEASGVRAIRLTKECALTFSKQNGNELRIFANDFDETAIKSLRHNLKENNVNVSAITQLNADEFFATSEGLDIIDIDPFGGPGPFIDGAVKRLSRGGLLCVTATDTAPLCGVFPDVCLRKYWATPSHDMSMNEWAVRILVRYCQLIGAQYDKALIPILCYKKDHYVRLYLQCKKSKELSSEIVAAHGVVFVNEKSGEISKVAKKGFALVGPMYLGPLVDSSAFDEKKFRATVSDAWADRLFDVNSVGRNTVGYFTVPQMCSLHKIGPQPSVSQVLTALRTKNKKQKKQIFAYESLDFVESIKSNCSYKEFVSALRSVGIKKKNKRAVLTKKKKEE